MQPCAQTPDNNQLELTNAYSEGYDELEQFKSIDTLNVINDVYSDCVKPDAYHCTENVDSLNN